MIEFRMPTLGADMEAGTLVEWLKRPGDTVARGDIIAVVDTEKGAIEIEVFDDGVIDRTVVELGQKVPVGTVLALIRPSGEAPGKPESVAAPRSAAAQQPPPARARVSPAARRRAQDLHVDVSAVEGRGPGGSVTVADVERAAAQGRRVPATPPDRLTEMRSAIGAAMTRAKREIPHLYLSATIDLTPSLTWLSAENQRRPVTERLLSVVLFVKAVARACVDVPALNGFWSDGFVPGPGVHVGCAIALRGGGLIAPALHDVDRKPLDVLAREFGDLVTRARAGGLRSSEMSDATITVTNLGDLGVDSAYAIIYPPQVAIVGFGRVVERPWVVDGRIEPRSVVTVSVSADHRATDGRAAGLFLAAIDRALQAPESL
jgi:pyruvate dehydrogenase E2 component (dihydrolipoamide acetyltransferase)